MLHIGSLTVGSSSLTGDQTLPPTVGVWNLSHWTIKEVPLPVRFDLALPRILSCQPTCSPFYPNCNGIRGYAHPPKQERGVTSSMLLWPLSLSACVQCIMLLPYTPESEELRGRMKTVQGRKDIEYGGPNQGLKSVPRFFDREQMVE